MISVNCTLTAMTRMNPMVCRYSSLQRHQQVMMQQVADRGRQCQYKRGGKRHAERRLEIPRHPHERTQAKEPYQYKIVDQYCTDQDEDQFAHEMAVTIITCSCAIKRALFSVRLYSRSIVE